VSLSPWLALGAAVATAAAAAAGYHYGGVHKADELEARAARDGQIARMAVDAANSATGQAIARIRVRNTTIRGEIQREIRTNTVYADCQHTPEQLSRINAALAGDGSGTQGADPGGMPASGPAR
jgi:hypothetical protein